MSQRLCKFCQRVLHLYNSSTRCGPCARRYCCRDCGELKEDLSRSRCASCRARYQRVFAGPTRQGRRPEAPSWLEERIREYQKRAEQGLPLFD